MPERHRKYLEYRYYRENLQQSRHYRAMDLTCLIAVFFVPIITYWYLKRIHTHWDNQNVPCIPNPNIIFGHVLPIISIKENVAVFVEKAYKSFNSSVVGFYFMRRPGIIVRDPELVKSVMQTNFSSFRDNFMTLSEKHDPVLVKNPFFTSDPDLWKERRNRVSENFSGKKLKYLAAINQEVCRRLSAFVERKIRENGGVYECELKEFFSRCTGEVVANSAFGIEGQSFDDNPDRLSFTEVAKTLFEPTFINGIKQALLFFLPGIAKFFGIAMLDKKVDEYMRQNIKAIIEKRQQKSETPNDFLQFSVEANSYLDGILADLVNFYGDVYETSSLTLNNLFYHLSINPEIQSKLRNHIMVVLKESNGQVSYESVKNMTYLDQVISESLRMIPPGGVLLKICTEEITLKGSDGVTCHLKPGNPVFLPLIGLHFDEKYWSDPEVFNPDRFSPENQLSNKYAYLPFGEGPRKCVGMRFALMLVKQATATLITMVTIERSSKTKVPLEIQPTSVLTYFKGGLWACFRKVD